MPADGDTTLIHASVGGPWRVTVPEGVDAFALVLRGAGRLGAEQVTAQDATSLPAGVLSIDGDALEVLIGWSAPMPSRPQFRGPFCMFAEPRLNDAMGRYRAGGMGRLA
jgi:redox-sensitive bicupin YhaK (pirin superfamily)